MADHNESKDETASDNRDNSKDGNGVTEKNPSDDGKRTHPTVSVSSQVMLDGQLVEPLSESSRFVRAHRCIDNENFGYPQLKIESMAVDQDRIYLTCCVGKSCNGAVAIYNHKTAKLISTGIRLSSSIAATFLRSQLVNVNDKRKLLVSDIETSLRAVDIASIPPETAIQITPEGKNPKYPKVDAPLLKDQKRTYLSCTCFYYDEIMNMLFLSDYDKRDIKVYDGTFKLIGTLTGHRRKIVAFAAIHDEDHAILVSGSSDRHVRLWDMKRLKCLKSLRGHSSSVYSLYVDMHIYSGSRESVRIWDRRGHVQTTIRVAEPVEVITLCAHNQLVYIALTTGSIGVYNHEGLRVCTFKCGGGFTDTPFDPHAAFHPLTDETEGNESDHDRRMRRRLPQVKLMAFNDDKTRLFAAQPHRNVIWEWSIENLSATVENDSKAPVYFTPALGAAEKVHKSGCLIM